MSRLTPFLDFLGELKRRKVTHVALLYLAAWFAALEIVDVFVATYRLPQLVQLIAGLVAIAGFPVALTLSWMFEWGPEGVRPDPEGPLSPRGRTFLYTMVAALALTAVGLGAWQVGERVGDARRQSGTAATAATEPASDEPVVAVLPLLDASPDSANGWMAEALQAGLTDALSNAAGVAVRSHEAVEALTGLPLDSIGRLLDAQFFVGGTLSATRDSALFTAQLVDARTGRVLRSVPLRVAAAGSPLTLTEELTARTLTSLLPALGTEVRTRQWRASTSNARAFRLRYEAEQVLAPTNAQVNAGALDGAEQAYAQADSLLVASHTLAEGWAEPVLARAELAGRRGYLALVSGQGTTAVARRFEEGRTYLDDLLGQDPENAEALALRGRLGLMQYFFTGQDAALEQAETDLRQALRMAPSNAEAAAALGSVLYDRGEFEEARLYAQRALQLDAYLSQASQITYQLAISSFQSGDDSAAIHWCRAGQRRFPDEAMHYGCELDVLAWGDGAPDVERAWHLRDDVLARTPPEQRPGPRLYYGLAVASVLARAQLPDSARGVLDRTLAERPPSLAQAPDGLWLEAAVRYRLGDTAAADALLERFRASDPARAQVILEQRALRAYAPRPRELLN